MQKKKKAHLQYANIDESPDALRNTDGVLNTVSLAKKLLFSLSFSPVLRVTYIILIDHISAMGSFIEKLVYWKLGIHAIFHVICKFIRAIQCIIVCVQCIWEWILRKLAGAVRINWRSSYVASICLCIEFASPQRVYANRSQCTSCGSIYRSITRFNGVCMTIKKKLQLMRGWWLHRHSCKNLIKIQGEAWTRGEMQSNAWEHFFSLNE